MKHRIKFPKGHRNGGNRRMLNAGRASPETYEEFAELNGGVIALVAKGWKGATEQHADFAHD
jgi:hypothetical protein